MQSNRSLDFGRVPHDPHGFLTAIYGLALVGIELSLNLLLCCIVVFLAGQEDPVAVFADGSNRERRSYDPQLTFRHVQSLAQRVGAGVGPVDFKRHHYRSAQQLLAPVIRAEKGSAILRKRSRAWGRI
jgi:hypothetical protein